MYAKSSPKDNNRALEQHAIRHLMSEYELFSKHEPQLYAST
jgi:hypothetical protein